MTLPDVPLSRAEPPPANRKLQGIILMALGFLCYSISDATAKALTARLDPIEVVWFRQLGLLAVAAWFLLRRGLPVLRTRRPVLQVVRGFVAALSSTCFVSAVAYVPLADAVAVSFVAPFIVTVLGALLLREPVGIRRWSAIAVGFAGMLIVVRPGLGAFHTAMFLVLAAAALFAARQILSRLIGTIDATATTIAYTSVGSTLLLTVPMVLVWTTPTTFADAMMIALIAIPAGAGEVLIIRALELAHAVVLAPLQYSMIVWSTFFGWMAFSQIPDGWTWAGAVIIVASGIYTFWREARVRARAAG
jgi:drug/metabolite transporter (DMT)-like permease